MMQPETEHRSASAGFSPGSDGGGKSPNVQVMKSRLRKIL